MPGKERVARKHIDYKKMASKGLSGGFEEKDEGTAETEYELKTADPVGASVTLGKSEEAKTEVTPGRSGVLSDGRKIGNDEKKKLMEQLAELEKKEERLREQKELQFLRKQVQEREARIRDLEKDVSKTVTSTNFGGDSVAKKTKSRLAASLTGSVTPSSPGARQEKTTVSAPAGETGMPLFDINSLRQMTGLRKKAKKRTYQNWISHDRFVRYRFLI